MPGGERRLRILGLIIGPGDVTLSSGRLCEVSAQVTGMSGAGIMLMSGDVPRGSLCTTDAVSDFIEQLQYELGEGPCVDAYQQDWPVLEPDLANPQYSRWPAFGHQAVEVGAGAVFGFPLHVGSVRLGALNLYRDEPGPLTDDQHADALVLADLVAQSVLVLQASAQPGALASELEAGADFHYTVHQASGMVSVQLGATIGQALIRLRAYAFSNDIPLAEVAESVISRTLRFTRQATRAILGNDIALQPRYALEVHVLGRLLLYPPSRGPTTPPDRRAKMPMTREAKFARTLVELADTLVTGFDVVELLTALADRCVDVLDVGAAGMMLAAPDGALRVMASSSEAMRILELFELEAQEGPCLDCYRTGNPVVNQDLATNDGRWPRFATQAIAAGFHSAHTLPMRLRGTVIGALNLFHVEPDEMRETDTDRAQALADIATIAILQYRATLEAQLVNEQLNHALNSRIVIEQAKGIIAERQHLNMGQAFSALRSYARSHNRPLVEVAEAVIGGSVSVTSPDHSRQQRTVQRE